MTAPQLAKVRASVIAVGIGGVVTATACALLFGVLVLYARAVGGGR